MVASGVLGCGAWRAVLECRGGGTLLELPFSDLTMGRRLDDMSTATVNVAAGELARLGQQSYERCCAVLAELEPWQHEIALWRDDYLAWVGPVVSTTWKADALQIGARDLFQWYERRLLPHDRDFFGVDLADIFHTLAVDAMHRDPTPHVHLSPSPTGVLGERTVLADAFRRAADEMRELLRTGVDMTMEGRTMHVGGVEVPVAELGILITEHFDNLELSFDGLQTETESVVIGSNTNTILGPVTGVAGGPVVGGIRTVDPVRGLVQNVSTESNIEDEASAIVAAQTRIDLLSTSPVLIKGQLLSSAPVKFSDLLPGARADMRLQVMCRRALGDHRLQSVDVKADNAGTETVGVVFTNLGTVEETI